MNRGVRIRFKNQVVNIMRGDRLAVKTNARPGKEKDGPPLTRLSGEVVEIYADYCVLMSRYRQTVSYRDIICGHARIVEHTRGGRRVDPVITQAGTGAGNHAEREQSEEEPEKTGSLNPSEVGHKKNRLRRLLHSPDEYSQF